VAARRGANEHLAHEAMTWLRVDARVPHEPQLRVTEHRRLDRKHPGDVTTPLDTPSLRCPVRCSDLQTLLLEPSYRDEYRLGYRRTLVVGMEPP
jgi:hypothetical protein